MQTPDHQEAGAPILLRLEEMAEEVGSLGVVGFQVEEEEQLGLVLGTPFALLPQFCDTRQPLQVRTIFKLSFIRFYSLCL